MAIRGISEAERLKLRRKSAYHLPDNPTQRGMKPDEIRGLMAGAAVDEKDSLVEYINRLASDTGHEVDESRRSWIVEILEHEWESMIEGDGLMKAVSGLAPGDLIVLTAMNDETAEAVASCGIFPEREIEVSEDGIGALVLRSELAPTCELRFAANLFRGGYGDTGRETASVVLVGGVPGVGPQDVRSTGFNFMSGSATLRMPVASERPQQVTVQVLGLLTQDILTALSGLMDVMAGTTADWYQSKGRVLEQKIQSALTTARALNLSMSGYQISEEDVTVPLTVQGNVSVTGHVGPHVDSGYEYQQVGNDLYVFRVPLRDYRLDMEEHTLTFKKGIGQELR